MLKIEHPHPGVRLIGLDRASKRNAIGVEMTLAISRALHELRSEEHIKSVVFYGVGGHFCAGMDLKDFFDNSTRDANTLRSARAATEEWRCHLIRNLKQRLFVAVEGYCLGAAMPIIQSAHHVVAHSGAQFGLPELNFGFVPGGQIIKSVSLSIPPKALSYLALTGKLINADQARQWSLVDEVLSEGTLDHTLKLACQHAKQTEEITLGE
jgi:enoyl-CoA hydratase/carnithine racemase